MTVTEVRVKKADGKAAGKLLGYATVTLDGQLVIHNIRIIDGKDGPFIAMPCRKLADGQYKDVVHPIDTGFREYLKEQILASFDAGQSV